MNRLIKTSLITTLYINRDYYFQIRVQTDNESLVPIVYNMFNLYVAGNVNKMARGGVTMEHGHSRLS